MDPQYSLQDVVRCTLCQDSLAPMYCEVCLIHLCKDCVVEHLSDNSKIHNVVSLKQHWTTLNYPRCRRHATIPCEIYCEQCDIPICTKCISSGKHLGHKCGDILQKFEDKKEVLQRELQELEKSIYPKYQEIVSNISVQKEDLSKNSQKLTIAINKQGEVWHKEIDTIIRGLKSNLEEMESKYLKVLNKQEDEITRTISEITQSIAELKKLQNSKDACLVSEYKSRIAELRRLPPKLEVSLPNFRPQEIRTDQLIEQFGSLSVLSLTTQEQVYSVTPQGAESFPEDSEYNPRIAEFRRLPHNLEVSLLDLSPEKIYIDQLIKEIGSLSALSLTREEKDYSTSPQGAESSPQDKSPMFVPRVNIAIDTGHQPLLSVMCLNDTEVWTCGGLDNKMILYNLFGNVVKSVQTKSGNTQEDIAVTRSGNLVYTDFNARTVTILKNTQIQKVIRLRGWRPQGVCSASSGDLLVVVDSNDLKLTKVVCYSGSTKKQSIQYNNKGQPLYSPGDFKYISENRNLDICVSDPGARAIVVVNQAGNFRFTYTSPPSTTKRPFDPRGITTDSQGQILTADCDNHCIHILNEDGQFLRYIDNCHLQSPYGVCVDTKDNLFVAECGTGIVKRIQYSY